MVSATDDMGMKLKELFEALTLLLAVA